MVIEEDFNPNIGKEAIAQHERELEGALRQLASALTKDTQFSNISEFFHTFMHGFWEPFEEVCKVEGQRHAQLRQELVHLEHQIREALDPETYQQFCRYGDLIAQRNSDSLEDAFLVGFQCAIRFLLMGIIPAAQIVRQEEDAQ